MKESLPKIIGTNCGSTGIDTIVPTNTIQVQITTGTVMDSGSVYTGLYNMATQAKTAILYSYIDAYYHSPK